jgi:Xaa-Pro aminopeptidase
LDALVLRLPENVLLLTQYWLHLAGMGLVFVPQEGDATLVTLDYEAAAASQVWNGDLRTISYLLTETPPVEALAGHLRDLCREHGVADAKIGVEGSFEAVGPPAVAAEPMAVGRPAAALIESACASATLHDFTEDLEVLRAVKLPSELDRLRITNEIAVIGLEAFRKFAVAGTAEADLASRVEGEILRAGSSYRGIHVVRAYSCIWSGPETANGWWSLRAMNRTIEKNDLVLIELATVADGYWSDHTRTVVAGRAKPRQRDAAAAVREAQRCALEAARPGARGHDVDAAARHAIASLGLAHAPTPSGHGVGFRYHEPIVRLGPDSEDVLAENMVITVEPAIYEKGLGGFRWEDDAVVTDRGGVKLADTAFEFEL